LVASQSYTYSKKCEEATKKALWREKLVGYKASWELELEERVDRRCKPAGGDQISSIGI
jgi:hypothetical protein